MITLSHHNAPIRGGKRGIHMPDNTLPTQEWLQQELDFINRTMAATLNGRLKAELHSCDEESQELTLRFPLQDWQVNGLGTLHGGMLSTMLDLAMSMAVYCFSRQSIPPTISMTVNYLASRPHGGRRGAYPGPFDLSGPPQRHRLL